MSEQPITKMYMDAEFGVLGSLLIDPACVAHEIFSRVRSEDFIHANCREIFEAARTLYTRGDTLDALTISDAAGGENRALLMSLMDRTPTAAHVSAYIDLLLDWAKRHRVAELSAQLGGLCAIGAPVMDVMALSERISSVLAGGAAKDTYTMAELQVKFLERLDKPRHYLDWGFDKINRYVYAEYGSGNSNLIVIGARPSTGKTAFALNFSLEMAKRNRVMFFSFETDEHGVADRIETAQANVDFGRIKRGETDAEDLALFIRQQKRLSALQFQMVKASGLTVEAIRARAKRYKADVVVIDYLQLVEVADRKMNEYERTTTVSRALQALARSGICVIALSQLNRAEAGGMSALRGSGQIEQDADVVMLLEYPTKDMVNSTPGWEGCWDEISKEQLDCLRALRIGKNRDGRAGDVLMRFDGAHQRFAVGWPEFMGAKCQNAPKAFKSAAKPQALPTQVALQQ